MDHITISPEAGRFQGLCNSSQSLTPSVFRIFWSDFSTSSAFTLFGCKIATKVVGIIFRYNKLWQKNFLCCVLVRKTFSRAQKQSSSATGHIRVMCLCLCYSVGWESSCISSLYIGEICTFRNKKEVVVWMGKIPNNVLKGVGRNNDHNEDFITWERLRINDLPTGPPTIPQIMDSLIPSTAG